MVVIKGHSITSHYMDSTPVGVDEVGCRSMMRAHFEKSTDTYSRCSRWSRLPLSRSSEFLKLFTPTHQAHTEPVGNLVNVSVHPLLDLCFSSHSLVLCSFQQFFVSSAYCFVMIYRMHAMSSFQPLPETWGYSGSSSSLLDKDQF